MAAMKALRFIACAIAWIAAVVCVAWAFGALYFDFPTARTFTAILFVLVLITAIIFVRGKLLKLAIVFGAFALVALWWLTLKPGNDRAWQPDVAQTAWAQINGDEITVHNVRNCDYRTETDFTPLDHRHGRSYQLLGLGLDRTSDRELSICPCASSLLFHRDAQDYWTEVLRTGGPLSAIHAHLRRSRCARLHSSTH